MPTKRSIWESLFLKNGLFHRQTFRMACLDPSNRKILEGETTFRLAYMLSGCVYQVEKEKTKNCRPLTAERPVATMFVIFIYLFITFFVSSSRNVRAKVVYMVLGSSYLSARKILSLESS